MLLSLIRNKIERLNQILTILHSDNWLYNSTIKDLIEEELKDWETKLKEKEQTYANKTREKIET